MSIWLKYLQICWPCQWIANIKVSTKYLWIFLIFFYLISGTLVSIVQGLGSITESLAPFLHDVIYMSTHLNNSCSVYLLEDGLELWLVALQNSKHLLPQWMQLASNIPPILELSSENLRTMIYIVQAYIVLAPNEFVATCGASVMKPLDDQYGKKR